MNTTHGYALDGPVFVQFLAAAERRGLILPSNLLADGQIHRCDVAKGRHGRGRADGSYLLHLDGGVPAGGFQNHTDGLGWENWHVDIGRAFTLGEQREIKRRQEAAREAHEEARERDATKAREKAARLWDGAAECTTHPYLVAKKVSACGARILYGTSSALAIPMRDADGNIHSLQMISPDGKQFAKRFLAGGRVAGHFYRIDGDERICICEGFATGATIHQTTGHTVVVAFGCGNLMPVAKVVREKYPDAEIVVCAEDDHTKKGNPGLTKAREVAQAIKGYLAVPHFGINRRPGDSDFNDLATLLGDHHVVTCIEEALKQSEVTEASATPDPAKDDGILAELAKMSRFEYDRRRRDAAKQLGITVSTLDKAVGERRASIKDDSATLPHWVVEPWAGPVDGAALLDAICQAFTRYVILPAHAAEAIALWVVHAWTVDSSDISPFLVLVSPEKRCGKTTVLILLYWLTPRSELASNISGPAIFRYIEDQRPTLLIDEADTFMKDDENLRGILNSGHTRVAAHIIRCDGEDNKPRRFSTWAPKAIATIPTLADTLADRAVMVTMQRKKKTEKVERLRRNDNAEFAWLRQQALRWTEDNIKRLEQADPEIPGALNDRAADNWRPMFAIADLAGGGWPGRAREASLALSGEDATDDAAIRVMLLKDIRAAFVGHERMSSQSLIQALCVDTTRPWCDWKHGKPITPRQLAGLLGAFGIISVNLRIGEQVLKGFELSAFTDAFSRYLSGDQESNPPQRYNADGSGVSDVFSSATEPERSGHENDNLAHGRSDCSVVANEKAISERKEEIGVTGAASSLSGPEPNTIPGGATHIGKGSKPFGQSILTEGDAKTGTRSGADLDIPAFLDRRAKPQPSPAAICAQCGAPGDDRGLVTEYEVGRDPVWLHRACHRFYVKRREAS